MSNKINKEKVRQFLKDANVYEDNMSDDLMNEYYEAIQNSLHEDFKINVNPLIKQIKDADISLNESANELLEAINNSNSIAPTEKQKDKRQTKSDDEDDSLEAFSQDMLQNEKTVTKNDETNNNVNVDKCTSNSDVDKPSSKNSNIDNILDGTKAALGFNNMPKSEDIDKNMLKVKTHDFKYVNVQNSKKFLISNSEFRIEMLYDYHFGASQLKAYYASLSTNMVPIGKPITAIDYSLCVNPVISSLKDEKLTSEANTTYISRSGRLTKRKLYNEDEYLQEDTPVLKKNKNNDDWKGPKSAKTNTKKSELDKNQNNNNNDKINSRGIRSSDVSNSKSNYSPDSSQIEDNLAEYAEDSFDALLKENQPSVSKPRTYQRKNMSNQEIMSRSSLFKDSSTPKKGRTASLLDAAKKEIERKMKEEKEMESFKKLLDTESEAFEEEPEEIIVDDEVFEKKRIVPPIPQARRPIHGKKRGGVEELEPLSIFTKKPNTSREEINSPKVNGTGNSTPLSRGSSQNNLFTTRRGKKEVTMTLCPLCSVSFPQKEIEEHAATCGEEVFTAAEPRSRITCEVCEQVIPLATEYNVHVQSCKAKKNCKS